MSEQAYETQVAADLKIRMDLQSAFKNKRNADDTAIGEWLASVKAPAAAYERMGVAQVAQVAQVVQGKQKK